MKHQIGVSLLEILIVVSILGIVAAVAIPDFSPSTEHKLDLAATEVADAVRFARSEATRTGVPHGVFTQTSQNRIRVFRADTGTTPATPIYDVRHPIDKKLYDIDLDAYPFAGGITFSGASTSFQGTCNAAAYTIFDATGAPRCSDPITVILRSADLTLTSGVSTRVVSIHGFTGRVTIQ